MPFSRAHIHTSTVTAPGKRQRAIIVVGDKGTLPERLRTGLERELPWAVLYEAELVQNACNVYPETVSLILIHPDHLVSAEHCVNQLQRFHPLALVGLLQVDGASGQCARSIVTSSKFVQGLVPLDAKVHEFVAIISFMLRGGQYFPREILLAVAPEPVAPQPAPVAHIEPEVAHMAHLTRRELEILELVSRGLQNKSIAAKLSLSEFTVKIHLHNIITKLGAHNRTEAVAFFRDRNPGPALVQSVAH